MNSKLNILLVGSNGYIGSHFYNCFKNKYKISLIDNGFRPYEFKANDFILRDYRKLNLDYLSEFTHCVWLAGHSSVPQSIKDPLGCFSNNLTGLADFYHMFPGSLIYASSGSVYNNNKSLECNEEEISSGAPFNMYDFTKISFDNYLNIFKEDKKNNWIGLRFGTVVGSSQKIRTELLLNRMVFDAINNNKINLANSKVFRPILFIDDLVNAIDTILQGPEDNFGQIYNLCSINASMEEYASNVSRFFDVPINVMSDSKTYNFGMTSKKFSDRYKFNFTQDLSAILTNIQGAYIENNYPIK